MRISLKFNQSTFRTTALSELKGLVLRPCYCMNQILTYQLDVCFVYSKSEQHDCEIHGIFQTGSFLLQWRHNESDYISNHRCLHCFSTVGPGADQRKDQSSASLASVRGVHRWRVNYPPKKASNAENVSIWWRHHVVLDIHLTHFILTLHLATTKTILLVLFPAHLYVFPFSEIHIRAKSDHRPVHSKLRHQLFSVLSERFTFPWGTT